MTRRGASPPDEGWHGWDEYAPFYDWENARTVARRDVAFWERLARVQEGPVLELGCGTGRLTLPVARTGSRVVGIDRSAAMLVRGQQRLRRARLERRVSLVRGDIRRLPFRRRPGFALVMAPYGMLQSLTRERDLRSTLESVNRVLARKGLFVVDLVPDLPRWQEYDRQTSLSGTRGGARVKLIESVQQDVRRGLTIFEQEFVESRGRERRVQRFSLTFRTLSVPQMSRRLERAGFEIRAVLGDYQGGPWDTRSDTWVIVAARH